MQFIIFYLQCNTTFDSMQCLLDSRFYHLCAIMTTDNKYLYVFQFFHFDVHATQKIPLAYRSNIYILPASCFFSKQQKVSLIPNLFFYTCNIILFYILYHICNIFCNINPIPSSGHLFSSFECCFPLFIVLD